VKSRVATDSGAFRLSSLDFDFIVFVRLNRGTKLGLKEGKSEEAIDPQFFIVPHDFIASLCEAGSLRVPLSRISDERFLNNWASIKDALRELKSGN